MPLSCYYIERKQIRYSARDLNMRPSQSLGFAYCGIRLANLDEVYPSQRRYNICARYYSR